MSETVAIVTLLDDRKAGLIPQLVPRWNAIDLGGRSRVYVCVRNDASDETCAVFAEAVREGALGTVFVTATDLDAQVWDLESIHDRAKYPDPYANPVFMHRMSWLREAGRQGFLKLEIDEVKAEWAFWVDQDVAPEPDAFLRLLHHLTATTGPLAPRVLSGLYATRFGGTTIPQWIDGDDRRYIPLQADRVIATRVSGYGCILAGRAVMEEIGFNLYGRYRKLREEAIAEGADPEPGVLGEDVFWFRLYELATGLPPMVDTAVLCRHYHADGSYWAYTANEDGNLVPGYCTDEADQAGMVRLRYLTEGRCEFPRYGIDVASGEVVTVSPEVAFLLRSKPNTEWAVEKAA